MIFNGGDGSLLAISFYFDYGGATITNTETDEGKLEGWEIALIIIAIVIIVVCVIIYLCYIKEKITTNNYYEYCSSIQSLSFICYAF